MIPRDSSWKPRAMAAAALSLYKKAAKSTIARSQLSVALRQPRGLSTIAWNTKWPWSMPGRPAAETRNPTGAIFNWPRRSSARDSWAEAAEALNRAIAANPGASSYHYVLSGVYRRLGKTNEAQEQMEIFRKLEKETTDFEQKRRESRRETPGPKQDPPR